ncbi:hypothetical protein [Niveibacterium sp.]|uniref:hypothetical protein n=1 Tax=Niveibacterium sp. TaxID=2017444 RepID=UPI0035AEA537
MPKILILETCIVNYRDDRGGVAEEAGALITVDAEQARLLTTHGRALYTSKGDDATKGRYTAPADVIKAAEAIAKEAAKDAAKSGADE